MHTINKTAALVLTPQLLHESTMHAKVKMSVQDATGSKN